MNVDREGRRELLLRQSDESTQGDDVVATGDPSTQDPVPLLRGIARARSCLVSSGISSLESRLFVLFMEFP